MTDIIALLERREEQALELLKSQYGEYCYSIIYGLLQDHQQAEEAVNDVWLKLWSSIPPAHPQRLRPYIAKTARNTALTYIKRDSAQKRSGITVLLDELAECTPDPTWEKQANGKELKETLNRFLHSLGEEEQRIFIRRYWYGASIQELAQAFGCSQNRITGILFRTRKHLRKYLKKEGYTV